MLAEILVALNEQVDALCRGGKTEVLDRWRALSPSASGARVEWPADGTIHQGVSSGIDDDGALLVRTGSGLERIIAGEVVWRCTEGTEAPDLKNGATEKTEESEKKNNVFPFLLTSCDRERRESPRSPLQAPRWLAAAG